MFYEEIGIKEALFYISFRPFRILYKSKFIILATFLGTNAVVVTRVHCINMVVCSSSSSSSSRSSSSNQSLTQDNLKLVYLQIVF